MSHAHSQIRAALVATLTGLNTTGARVYASRIYPLTAANLPGLRIYTDADAIEQITLKRPVAQKHVLSALIECCATGSVGMDEDIDQISMEVEIKLSAGITVGGKTIYPFLTGSDVDMEPGSPAVGVKRLNYQVEYFAQNDAPGTFI